MYTSARIVKRREVDLRFVASWDFFFSFLGGGGGAKSFGSNQLIEISWYKSKLSGQHSIRGQNKDKKEVGGTPMLLLILMHFMSVPERFSFSPKPFQVCTHPKTISNT